MITANEGFTRRMVHISSISPLAGRSWFHDGWLQVFWRYGTGINSLTPMTSSKQERFVNCFYQFYLFTPCTPYNPSCVPPWCDLTNAFNEVVTVASNTQQTPPRLQNHNTPNPRCKTNLGCTFCVMCDCSNNSSKIASSFLPTILRLWTPRGVYRRIVLRVCPP